MRRVVSEVSPFRQTSMARLKERHYPGVRDSWLGGTRMCKPLISGANYTAGRCQTTGNDARELVCCPTDTHAKSLQLGKDRISGGGPDERFAIGIVVGDEMINTLNQLAHRAERAAPDGAPR